MSDEDYILSVQATNEELEMELQIQSEERVILEARIESMKKLLNEFEAVCSGRGSDPMIEAIKKWRRLKTKMNKENIV